MHWVRAAFAHYRARVAWLSLASALGGLAACESEAPKDEGCSTLRDEFAEKVWASFMSTSCVSCHQPGGLAWEQSARFALVPATYPGFLDQNLEAVRAMAGYEFEGQPLLLAKPLNKAPHGGSVQLKQGSREYENFRNFLERLDAEDDTTAGNDQCVPDVALPEVERLTPAETLRKASLQLVGRLPTEAEVLSLGDDPILAEANLATAVRAMLDEPAFADWLVTSWNDLLLTDLYGSYASRSLGLLNEADFPAAHGAYYDAIDDDVLERKVGNAVMREPLALIVHVVTEGLPFGDILTADYMMVNPYSARIYTTDASFTNGEDEGEWRPGKMHIMREGQALDWPHAGILSSPMILNRRPTTPTNLNRHRAWWVLKTFLATDVLTVASRPVDPDKASRFDYPWRQDSQCVVCHAVIDPIAGAFSKFDSNDQERYFPDRAPPANVFDPGYGEIPMPPDPSGGPLRWLGQKIVRDARFPLAVARLTYTMLTGRQPVEHPRDVTSPDYARREAAWADFDRLMTEVSARFEGANQDYRELVVALVTSPFFRADAVLPVDDEAVSAARLEELGDVGTARLLTPELLDKKITATMGLPWSRGWDKVTWLSSDYEILYGGIDSDRITQRLTVPNGVIAAVQARMANEVSCEATPRDFTLPQAERLLFTTVELDDAPTTLGGDDVPAAIERIRATIVHLHERLLGETPDEAEIVRAFELFKTVVETGRKAVSDKTEVDWLRCSAKKDPHTGEDLPAERRVERDPGYTVRGWMAVVTYLLSDYRFLYE